MPNAAVLTISDSRSKGLAEDKGGPAAEAALAAMGVMVTHRAVVPDEIPDIQSAVRSAAPTVQLVITTGGTGIADRDVTPEAIEPLLEKTLLGFGEIMRTGSFAKTPLSIISRGGAGIIGRTLVVMLPGSPRGAVDCLELLGPAIKHVLKVLDKQKVDCQNDAGAGG